jgi:lipopolysaccharide/colanic/teichoic acid biosynthesis glycosyltransferase
MQMDAEYVRTITLRGDLAIIGRTYGAVLKGHGR